jgi:hypothetical protein
MLAAAAPEAEFWESGICWPGKNFDRKNSHSSPSTQ